MKRYELLALTHTICSLELLKWMSDVKSFQRFCDLQGHSIDENEIYPGYAFCVECCVIEFIGSIASDDKLRFKTHYSLDFALGEGIYIEKLPLSCEKVIALRNIYNFVRPIKKAKNFKELGSVLETFNKEVLAVFQVLYDDFFYTAKPSKYPKETVLKAHMVHELETNYLQIGGFGPYAHNVSIITNSFTSKERLKMVFPGYKYAVQYLWWKLLEGDFQRTSLVHLHLADSWNTYVYLNPQNEDEHPLLRDRKFDLDKQTSLDSYFWRVNYEVYPLIENQLHIDPMSAHSLWRFRSKAYDKKKLFGRFLDKTKLKDPFDTLSWEDKILTKLLWEQFEFVEGRATGMHVGVATFNLMLAGSVELLKQDREKKKKVLVAKFIHPHDDNAEKRDYSYGIYVDSYATEGRNYKGWVIYSDACGDYSGFSGSEHKAAETLLKRYIKDKKVFLHELIIPLKEFTKFIAENGRQTSDSFISRKSKVLEDKLSKARSSLLELFVHHLHAKHLENTHKVSWSVDKQKAEIDIRITADDYVKIIECKVNPQNVNLQKAVGKIKSKLNNYSAKKKEFAFWFWKKPSVKTESFLEEHKIDYVTVEDRQHQWLASTDLSFLQNIMENSDSSKNYFGL